MSLGQDKYPRSVDTLESIVSTALAQDRLSGLSAVLESIALSFRAFACILWEVEPGVDLKAAEPKGRLYTLAEWTEKSASASALHDLPLVRSLTGEAVLTGQTQVCDDVATDSRVYRLNGEEDFFRSFACDQYCSIPLGFADAQGGALNLYRRKQAPFTEQEISQIEQVARLFPGFYRVLRDRVSFSLLRGCNEILSRAEEGIEWTSEGRKKLQAAFQEICVEAARIFGCLEVSLFLEDPGRKPDSFERVATTWPGLGPKRSFGRRRRDGLTTWVLREGRPLRLFDLKFLPKELSQLQERYPGISWKGLSRIEAEVLRRFTLEGKDALPPLSFLAVPISVDRRVVGAVRCFAATNPFYFGAREEELLQLLAQLIGERWGEWLHRRDLQEENEAWKALVASVAKLNHFVFQELSRPAPDEIAIFEQALRISQSVIRGAEISDIRLYDEVRKDLYFAAVHGPKWEVGSIERIVQRKRRRFGVAKPPKSAGAWVFVNNKVRKIDNVKNDSIYDGTFSDTKRMILAPISVQKRVYGVLDIRGTKIQPFPLHAENIAELLGKQLGLYHYLAITIGELRSTQSELAANLKKIETLQRFQKQAFEDLAHQLRSPINQAYQRVQGVLAGGFESGSATVRQLQAIRGLASKASRVTRSLGLFVSLARDERLVLRRSRLTYDPLVRLLIQAAEDNELLIEPERRIRFSVERDSFLTLLRREVQVDWRLMEQAIGNLCDNAGKYSFANSVVRIFGGDTGTGRFHVTVANRGLRLKADEAKMAKAREWRSEQAELTTQEGSGIGLWLVDHILRAHGGALVVRPTDSQGWTEVKLVFPIR